MVILRFVQSVMLRTRMSKFWSHVRILHSHLREELGDLTFFHHMVRFQVGDSSQEYLRWSVQGTHECESAFCHCFSVIILSNSPGRAFWLADNHIAKSNVGCFTGYSASDTHQQAK